MVSLYLCSSGSNARGESRALEGRRVSSKSPSRVPDGDGFFTKRKQKKLRKWQNLPEVIPVLEDDGVGLVVDVLGQVVVVLPNQPQRLLGRIHHATLRDL